MARRRKTKPAARTAAVEAPATVIRGRLPARMPNKAPATDTATAPKPEAPVAPIPAPETEAVAVAPAAKAEPQVAPLPRPATPETATTLLLDLLCRPGPGGQRPMLSFFELRGVLHVLRSKYQAGTVIDEIEDYLYWMDPIPEGELDVRRAVEAMFSGVEPTVLRRAIKINHEARDLIAKRHGEHVARELEEAIVEFVGQAMVDAATLVEPRDIVYCAVDDDVILGGGSTSPSR